MKRKKKSKEKQEQWLEIAEGNENSSPVII